MKAYTISFSSILRFGLACACGVACFTHAALAREVSVESPDGKNQIVLQVSDDDKVLFSVNRDGQPVIKPSEIQVALAEIGPLTAGATIQSVEQNTQDEISDMAWGKSRKLRDHCRTATIRLTGTHGVQWDIELRAYDDGVAWRYSFPEQEIRDLVIESESSQFLLAGDPSVLYLPLKNFLTSHEGLYQHKQLSEMPQDSLIATPLLATWSDGRAAAITEARLRDFAGMYLTRVGDEGLRTRLSPDLKDSKIAVNAKTPLLSPWRVVLLADHPGKMVESSLLLCLNDPADGDFSWAEPGKSTWHWWNGEVEHGPPSSSESNFAIHKKYIDFCARHKIKYHSVISVADNRPWYVQGGKPGFDPRPDTDVAKPRPDLGLPAILEYAKEKGVGIRLWVWWTPLSHKLEEAFAAYEQWGVKGLMIDFLDRDDQEMVEWEETVLESAARHKLHVQFHGSHKPTGEQRTFPNLFNREGVLNLEYLKWSTDCSPPHNVNVAYTRLLSGQVDYHLGGFRAAARDEFKPTDKLPEVLGTRCHQLALYVVYENPMPMLCDVPSAYEGQPGFDFLTAVPTTWDETKFVAGEAGRYIVVARRSGDTWYVGGITDWSTRDLKLPLEFLGEGKFVATIYRDNNLDGTKPNELHKEEKEITAGSTLDVSLASGGGVAVVIRPE
jgi:alpha-glucosidase